MTASELVIALQAAIAEHGDLGVVLCDNDERRLHYLRLRPPPVEHQVLVCPHSGVKESAIVLNY